MTPSLTRPGEGNRAVSTHRIPGRAPRYQAKGLYLMASRNRAASTEDTTVSTEDTSTNTAIAVPAPNYSADTLREIDSFQSAIAAAGYMFGSIDDASDVLGDGFKLMSTEDKAKLVGVPMVLLEWSFYPSQEHGGEFCALRLVAQGEGNTVGKYVVNDGSTGLARTLKEYTARTGRQGGLVVRRGFRASEYPYCDDCRVAVDDSHKADEPTHKVGRARTYYFDTSA